MPIPEIKEMLEAGVHFGHLTKRWNPKMRKFILTEKNGIYVIDLAKTQDCLTKAIDAVRTKDRLTEPAFVVAVPLVLRGPAAFKTLCPQWQEQTEIRQRPGGHIFHVLDRIQQR